MENQKLNDQLEAIKKLNKENYDNLRKQIFLLNEALNKNFIRPEEKKEAVKENEYTILSFVNSKGDIFNIDSERGYRFESWHPLTKSLTIEQCLDGDELRINSIRRESDGEGEVFTLGDTVCFNSNEDKVKKIEAFEIVEGFLSKIALHVGDTFRWGITHVKKSPIRKPILVTEDGKEIFEGDEYILFSVLTKSNWAESRTPCNRVLEWSNELKHFHTKEAREEYIKWNKPMYNLKDIDDAISEYKLNGYINLTKLRRK